MQVNHKPVTMAPHRADESALVVLQLGLVVVAYDQKSNSDLLTVTMAPYHADETALVALQLGLVVDAYDQKSDWDLVMVTQGALLG